MQLDLQCQLQRYLGLDERELLASIKEMLPYSDTLVDIGANDGYYTMAFLRSGAKRVIACEPGIAMNTLLANAEVNDYKPDDRFTIERRLVGSQQQMISVSDLLRDRPQPILLKVDVDGGEFDILRSAEGYPDLPALWWIIETNSEVLEVQCQQWLKEHNFKTEIIRNASWRRFIPEQCPLSHNRWLVGKPNNS